VTLIDKLEGIYITTNKSRM